MIIKKTLLLEKFAHVKDEYWIEIETGKTFAVIPLDEPQLYDCVKLVSPMEYEEGCEDLIKSTFAFNSNKELK